MLYTLTGKDMAGNPSLLKEAALFSYSLKHLPKKDKIRFYYALKGRDGKSGIIKLYHVEQLGRTVLLVSHKQKADIESFLKFWKCSFKTKEVWLKK